MMGQRPGQMAVLLVTILAVALVPGAASGQAAAVPASAAGQTLLRKPVTQADEDPTQAAVPAPAADPVPAQALAEEEAPAPAPAPLTNTPPAILKEITTLIKDEIRASKRQIAIAILAFVGGVLLVVNGKTSFEGFVVITVGMVAMFMAMNSVAILWNLDKSSFVKHFVGGEVFVAACYAAWLGIDGMNLLAGAIIGFLLAEKCQLGLSSIGASWMDVVDGKQWLIIFFYTIFCLACAIAFKRKGHLKLVAIISPLFGGALIASAVSYGIMRMEEAGYLGFVYSMFPEITPVQGSWIDFLQLLWKHDSRDVGIFAGSPYNTLGDSFPLDRVVGCSLWFILWVAGIFIQFPYKRRTAASARELMQSLLQTE